MDTLLRNLRYSVRVLARTPGFTITVVLTLAIAIGANGTVFSALDAVLLRPMAFPNPDRLVRVSEAREGAPISNTAPVRLKEWNEAATTFEAMAGWYTEDVSETSSDLPEKFRVARVSPRFMDVWRVEPASGRGLTAADHEPGATPVVLISHRFWVTHLDSDPKVLQRSLRFGDESIPIVGVMPASFRFPDRDVDLWAPHVYLPFVLRRENLWYRAYGRLKPGVSLTQARADLAVVQTRLAEQYPDTDRNVGVYLESFKETAVGSIRGSLWLLFGAVTVLLLIAATNIAALLLARAARRKQEVSVRLSLGASRRSVVAQTLTETFVLAVAGALLGLLVAAGGSAALAALVPAFPRIDEVAMDASILTYTAVSIVAVTFLCGLLPALRSASGEAGNSLGSMRRTEVSGRHSLQWLFVGVQVALSVTLLAGAGLLIRSFIELSRVDPGFEASHVLSFRVSGSYEDYAQLAPRVEGVLDELRALPGVEAAATSSPVPGVLNDGSGFQFGVQRFEIEGRVDNTTDQIAEFRVVSPSYFGTMQIPLRTSELCRERPLDTTQDAMVNQAFATRFLGDTPIGTRLKFGQGVLNVAGVVGDAREYSTARNPAPTVYRCRIGYATPALAFLLRTSGDPAAIVESVRGKIKELEPLRAVYDVAALSERIGDEHSQDRLRTAALALFAGTALALACLGVYGTLNYVANLRRREVGLRVALGALRGDIVAQFLGKALRVVAAGCAAGLLLSFGSSRLLSGVLFGVSTSDPLTLTGVLVLVTVVSVLAALLPAVRASRVPPMQVLRED